MRIGITGGIGSGKSEVTKYLRSIGEYVICADEVSRQLAEPGGEGVHALQKAFGEDVLAEDGSLDRKKLAALVFGDESKLKLLNKTMHPLILRRINELAHDKSGRVFIDAALLIQTGLSETVDRIWLVTAGESVRLERVIKRDGLSADEVRLRMISQLSDEKMALYADEIIENNGSVYELHRKVDALLKKL